MPDKLNDLRIHVLEEINALPWLWAEYYQHRYIFLQDGDKLSLWFTMVIKRTRKRL